MRRSILLALLVAAPAVAQDRAATEQRLQGLREQIEGVRQQVQQTRGREATALEALEGLEAEVQLREELVSGYRGRLGETRTETQTLRRSIERLETEIEAAKRSYRRRARHAYMHGRRNALALILSAGSVNQMLVRARYLQQFASRRRAQVERVAQKTSELRGREQEVRSTLEETQRLIQQTEAEQGRIAETRRERQALVADLRTQRGRLEAELQQREADAAQLAGLVQDLVAQERRRAEEERRRREAEEAERRRIAAEAEARRQAEAEAARIAEIERRARDAERRAGEVAQIRRRPEPRTPEPAAPPPEASTPEPAEPPAPTPEPVAEARPAPPPERRTTPTPRAEAPTRTAPATPPESRSVDLTGSFAQNRGRLPQPTDGTVTGRFGTRLDPVTNTRTSSPGIDISTAPGAPARAVFEGVVQRVGTIPTYGTYVMVTHGEYVTLYGNLSQVAVSQGQRVRAGQAIGRAGTAAQRRGSSLFFALYQGGEAVDPARWLR